MKRFIGLVLSTVFLGPNMSVIAADRASDIASTAIAVKMTAFEMPAEYNCPLFSNSPYADMLTSLDKMQENLNQVFPTCETKAIHTKLNDVSAGLQQKVLEAQLQQKNGQSYKLSQSAMTIVDLTKTLQQSLISVSTAKTKACYRSETHFRSMIFSINDTFQSLAPLLFDLASANPALTASLSPALKILAGADAVSKGLNLIEQIAKDSTQFDMSDKDNRINTVKNTCQYMKLYNRLNYLRLSRLGLMQSKHTQFQSDISELNRKVGIIKENSKSSHFEFISEIKPSRISTDASLEIFEKLKVTIPEEQSLIQKALADYEQARTDYNFPEITQCQLIKTSLKSTALAALILELKKFSVVTKNAAQLNYDLDGIRDYAVDLNKAITDNNRQLCTQLGQDWLRKMDRLFLVARQMMATYESQLIELNGPEYLIKQKILAKDAEKLKSAESNYRNLNTMLNYASFESSEVEKRAKGMHKYLFAGPDQVVSECQGREKDEACGFMDSVAGMGKAYYQEFRNQGPVFELLLNNEKYFNEAFVKMSKSMVAIQRFEDKFLPAHVKVVAGAADKKLFNQYILARDKNAFKMDHVTPKFLAKGASDYASICSHTKVVIGEYLKASTHMMATFGLCEMIKNVLHEPEVSKRLKNYCLPENEMTDSKVNQLRYKLAGQYEETSKKSELQVLYFNRSPKAFVDQLLVRAEELGCYAD